LTTLLRTGDEFSNLRVELSIQYGFLDRCIHAFKLVSGSDELRVVVNEREGAIAVANAEANFATFLNDSRTLLGDLTILERSKRNVHSVCDAFSGFHLDSGGLEFHTLSSGLDSGLPIHGHSIFLSNL